MKNVKSIHFFLVKPVNGKLYENERITEKGSLILDTGIENHEVVNRLALVEAVPTSYDGPISAGDIMVVHHNVFRKYYDMRGKEKFSSRLIMDDIYKVDPFEVFAFNSNGEWEAINGYCFVEPIENTDMMTNGSEQELHGNLRIVDKELINDGFVPGDTICFKPDSEYEFMIDDRKLYRMRTNNVCLKTV